MYSQDETLYVVDSAPFINQELNIFAKNIITIKEVLNEIKDKKAREFILNHDIKTQIPSEESIKHIIQFAKKTGDFASLSLTDIKVLALTLQLEWEIKGRDHLRKDPYAEKQLGQSISKETVVEPKKEEPKAKKTRKRRGKKSKTCGEGLVNESAEVNELESETDAVEVETESVKVEQEDQRLDIGADSTCVEDNKVDAIVQQTFILESDTNQESCDIDSDSDSDQGEWITPTNISKQKLKDTFGEQPVDLEVPLVACMTNDYAMQNVLLQLKLALVSPTGQRINKLKTWVLRCHACFQTTSVLDKVFCPKCGNNTLMRTSVGVDENGKMTIYLKKGFQYKNRGSVYSIPAPKGGRKGDIILREDQKEYAKALGLKKRLEKKIMNQEMGVAELFGESRLSSTGDPIIGHGRKNVNHVSGSRRR